MATVDYLVTDFGAKGDGAFKDTPALQAAIDACHRAGGGRVCVPAGTFLTGTLYLKDNVELHLSAGAVIRGSPDRADYNPDDAFPQNLVFSYEANVTGAHLILALEAKNVSLTGQGRIDGNCLSFPHARTKHKRKQFKARAWPAGQTVPLPEHEYEISEWRPGQMVHFVECQNVRVEDVELIDSPYWSLFLHGCDHVSIRGVRIRTVPGFPNGDGIDIDCCRNVFVSECDIDTHDDCLVIRAWTAGHASAAGLKDKSRICENVIASNCILSSNCNAIRVGVGDSLIRNCIFSNMIVKESRIGIAIHCQYDTCCKGDDIENLSFNNFNMDCEQAIHLHPGSPNGANRLKNVSFSQINASVAMACLLSGTKNCVIDGLRLRDIDLSIGGGAQTIASADELPRMIKPWDRKSHPAALYCAFARHVSLDGIRVQWGALDGPWKHAAILERLADISVCKIDASPPPGEDGPAVLNRE